MLSMSYFISKSELRKVGQQDDPLLVGNARGTLLIIENFWHLSFLMLGHGTFSI
jgi:hypothetical protein